MKVKCLNCGYEFELKKVYEDDNGIFTVCPDCKSSFDVDIDYSKYEVLYNGIKSGELVSK